MQGTFQSDGVTAARSFRLAAAIEAQRALRLLAVGVGDHTPIGVREQVAQILGRLAQLGAPVHELG